MMFVAVLDLVWAIMAIIGAGLLVAPRAVNTRLGFWPFPVASTLVLRGFGLFLFALGSFLVWALPSK